MLITSIGAPASFVNLNAAAVPHAFASAPQPQAGIPNGVRHAGGQANRRFRFSAMPSDQLGRILAGAHTRCRRQRGRAVCRLPKATEAVPYKAGFLQGIDRFSAESFSVELPAILGPASIANEAAFGDFDFLALARLGIPARYVQEVFTRELMQHPRAGALDENAASQAASMILSRLHPALARTDTPGNVVFGGLSHAKLCFAVDLMQALGLDHDDHPYPSLIRLADTAMAGAKHGQDFGSAVWRLQIPAALWFAHASGTIDLRTQRLRNEDMVQQTLEQLDRAQAKAWRDTWNAEAETIASLQREPPTREAIALNTLSELDLRPDGRHAIPWYSRMWRPQRCNIDMSYLHALMDACEPVIAHRLGRKIRPFEEVVRERRQAVETQQQASLATVLGIALNETDARTQDDWRSEHFEIMLPMARRQHNMTDGQPPATRWTTARLGVIVATSRGGEWRHYAVSPNLDNFIRPIEIPPQADADAALRAHVLNRLPDYFSMAGIACTAPCPPADFSEASFTSVPDEDNTHEVRLSPHAVEQAPDFYNTKRSLDERLRIVARQIDATAPGVLQAVEEKATDSMPFSSCFSAPDPLQLEADLQSCGLELSDEDKDRLRVRPSQPYHARIRQQILTADIPDGASQDAAARFIASLPTAPVRRGRPLAQTLPEIVREQQGRAGTSNLRLNHHRLGMGYRPPRDFTTALRKMLGADASLRAMTAALDEADRGVAVHGASPQFMPEAIMGASGRIGMRFTLAGVEHAGRVYVPSMEAEGIYTFELDGRYYQADLFSAYPRLRAFDLIEKERRNTALCREKRGALKKDSSKKKICPETQTVEPDNDGVEWQAFDHAAPAPGEFIQRAPIEGRQSQFPRREQTLFRGDNDGAFAGRDLVIVDQMLFERNPRRSSPQGAANGPGHSQYEPLAESTIRGRGLPPVGPLGHSMPARLVFADGNQRPTIEYELRSVDGAEAAPMTGISRIRTRIRRDFLSLPSRPGAPARGLVEVAENAYYQFQLPDPRNNGTAPVSLVRQEDRAAIAEFTNQATSREWVLTRPLRVYIPRPLTHFYIDVLQNGEAAGMVLDALEREAVDQRIYGDDSAVVTDALSRCMMPTLPPSPGAAEPPDEAVRTELSVALSNIARSPTMTARLREHMVDAYSLRRENFHFEEIHIPNSVPAGGGMMAYIEAELRQTLDLFSGIYADLDFSRVFNAPAEERMPRPPGAPNLRALMINNEFIRVFEGRNVAIAIVELKNGRRIAYHAVSSTKTTPRLTPEAARNPHDYVSVTSGGALAPSLPCLPNMTPIFSQLSREGDTERMLSARILREHRPDQVRRIRLVSRLPICHSCVMVCIYLAEQYKQSEFVFASFQELPKKPWLPTSTARP